MFVCNPKSKIKVLVGFALALGGCGKALRSNTTGSLSTTGEIPGVVLTSVRDQSGAIISDGTSLKTNMVYKFAVSGDEISELAEYVWTQEFHGTGACVRQPVTSPSLYEVKCSSAGHLHLSVTAINPDGAQATRSIEKTIEDSSQTVDPGNMVEFRVKAGTGTGAWNEAATIVEVFVGQTLRIINDDTVPHRLHTNGRPCPHAGADMTPGGGAYNCVIASSYDAALNGTVYDHNYGTGARFYLKAYDGVSLYANRCASCHGALASSEVSGATAGEIMNAISNVPAMQNLNTLSQKEIEAIGFSL